MTINHYFSAMQQNTFNRAKKMSLGHGSRIVKDKKGQGQEIKIIAPILAKF